MTRQHEPHKFDLFEAPQASPEAPGSLNLTEVIRDMVSEMIKQCSLSREEIAERMGDLTGSRITLNMLNTWTAESRHLHRFPLEYVPALERATGFTSLTDLLAQLAGGEIYYGRDALQARIGVLEMEKLQLSEKIKSLREKARPA